MYHRSVRIVPFIKSCCRAPAIVQSRNIWDLRPISPRNMLREMVRDMQRFETDFFGNRLRILAPRLIPIEGNEVNEDPMYRVNVDVEGFKPEDIKISMKDGSLKIEAYLDRTAEDGSRFQQSIVREFSLPSNVEPSTVKSLLHENGILTIEAQLNKQNKPKDIPVQHLEGGEETKSKM